QRRFSLPSGGPGRMLSDRRYAPLWQTLDAAAAFVLVHPGENDDPRLAPFYLTNLLSNPYETTVAIAHLVFGGVVARYPNITFCFAHGGGVAGRPLRAGLPDRSPGYQQVVTGAARAAQRSGGRLHHPRHRSLAARRCRLRPRAHPVRFRLAVPDGIDAPATQL